tara:strand:+ start:85 stop:900 length:816 start_codon:yes stop_codon:yes gene_type:complete
MPCSFCKSPDHWTRDRQGKVVCPKLLSVKCKYCHETGHTIRHCPILKEKKMNRNQDRRERRRNREVDEDGFKIVQRKMQYKKQEITKITVQKNKFDVFDDSEEEKEEEFPVIATSEEWPIISKTNVSKTIWEVGTSNVVNPISLYEIVSKIPISDNKLLAKWDREWPEELNVPSNLMEWRRINRFTMLGKNKKIQELSEKLDKVELKPLKITTAWSDYESECDDIRSEISYISNDLASEWNDSEKSYCAWDENIRYPTIGEYDPTMNDYYM